MNAIVHTSGGHPRTATPRRGTGESACIIVDALRLSDRELSAVLSRMSNRVDPAAPPVRWRRIGGSDDLPRSLVHICHQRGNCTTYLIKPRDVHDRGIVFLHGSYVHKGASCAVLLRTADGQPTQIPATVTHCRHLSGRVHEVFAEFDRSVQIQGFLTADGTPLAAAEYSSEIDPF